MTSLVAAAGADTVEKVVDELAVRFLSVPLEEKDRAALVAFLRGKLGSSRIQPSAKLEPALRELLYLVVGMPEYQLG
jgi:hypothetical protein